MPAVLTQAKLAHFTDEAMFRWNFAFLAWLRLLTKRGIGKMLLVIKVLAIFVSNKFKWMWNAIKALWKIVANRLRSQDSNPFRFRV